LTDRCSIVALFL